MNSTLISGAVRVDTSQQASDVIQDLLRTPAVKLPSNVPLGLVTAYRNASVRQQVALACFLKDWAGQSAVWKALEKEADDIPVVRAALKLFQKNRRMDMAFHPSHLLNGRVLAEALFKQCKAELRKGELSQDSKLLLDDPDLLEHPLGKVTRQSVYDKEIERHPLALPPSDRPSGEQREHDELGLRHIAQDFVGPILGKLVEGQPESAGVQRRTHLTITTSRAGEQSGTLSDIQSSMYSPVSTPSAYHLRFPTPRNRGVEPSCYLASEGASSRLVSDATVVSVVSAVSVVSDPHVNTTTVIPTVESSVVSQMSEVSGPMVQSVESSPPMEYVPTEPSLVSNVSLVSVPSASPHNDSSHSQANNASFHIKLQPDPQESSSSSLPQARQGDSPDR